MLICLSFLCLCSVFIAFYDEYIDISLVDVWYVRLSFLRHSFYNHEWLGVTFVAFHLFSFALIFLSRSDWNQYYDHFIFSYNKISLEWAELTVVISIFWFCFLLFWNENKNVLVTDVTCPLFRLQPHITIWSQLFVPKQLCLCVFIQIHLNVNGVSRYK